MSDAIRATREHVLAFRLAGHNLSKRRPARDLVAVAGACGMRNTPPGSALLAFNARLAGLTPESVEDALGERRTLIEALAMRISPHLVPTSDAAVFTLGALPADEPSARAALTNFRSNLDAAGITALDAIEQAAAAASAELADGPLTRSDLSAAMTRRLPDALSQHCRACDSTHVFESLFRLAGVRGAFVIAREGRGSVYVRADAWLADGLTGDGEAARSELLRRYLRCFGPSTTNDFAAWVGIGISEGRAALDRLDNRLIPVELDGARTWLHADDRAAFESPPEPTGVRLLPPYDAYLDQRDRATLIPDKALHRRVWATLGNPGVVLVNGEIAGVWRPKKAGRRLPLTVEPFGALTRTARTAIEEEAALLGPLRDAASVEVTFSG